MSARRDLDKLAAPSRRTAPSVIRAAVGIVGTGDDRTREWEVHAGHRRKAYRSTWKSRQRGIGRCDQQCAMNRTPHLLGPVGNEETPQAVCNEYGVRSGFRYGDFELLDPVAANRIIPFFLLNPAELGMLDFPSGLPVFGPGVADTGNYEYRVLNANLNYRYNVSSDGRRSISHVDDPRLPIDGFQRRFPLRVAVECPKALRL